MTVVDERKKIGPATMALSSPEEMGAKGPRIEVATSQATHRKKTAWGPNTMPNGDPPFLILWGADEEK
jgi:hypothetical protein